MLQGLAKFFHQLRNPHCPHCKEERENEQDRQEHQAVCQTCEVLKNQLDIANAERIRLIETITRVPEPESRPVEPPKIKLPSGRHLPWPARRRILEKEDRERARLMREAPKPDSETATVATTPESSFETVPGSDPETEALERELLSAQTARESAG